MPRNTSAMARSLNHCLRKKSKPPKTAAKPRPVVISRLVKWERFIKVTTTSKMMISQAGNFGRETMSTTPIITMAAKISGNPLIVPMHGLPILSNKWMDRIIFTNLIEGIIVITPALKNQYLTYDWVDNDYVRVIHNCLEVDFPVDFDKEQTQKQFGLPWTYPVIGIFGRLTTQKQHHLFLEAARIILDKMPKAEFLVVGEGPEREHIEKYSKELGISEHIHLLGMQKEVFKLYHYCDLVLLSSAYEGKPYVIIESMLMETPVVAFDVGGVVDAIPSGDIGIVVPQGDTQKMAEEAVSLLNDEYRLKIMGQKARLFVQDNFPMQKMVDETDLYIKELVNKRKSK